MRIGLEVHVQLPTASKLFCSCPTSASEPNIAVCPTCLGMPGSRPSLNRRALEMGLMIARMFSCQIPESTWFSRKTYFYPDLPKNFQITQYDTPIGEQGEFFLDDKRIRIRRVHLEEDPGRIRRVGKAGEEVSLIDYDRSGIPLVEIVTEPDLDSPAEARRFVTDMLIELRHLIGLSEDGEQSVRADCNLSVGEERVEVKNVTGLKNIERALKFEAMRQTKLLKAGKEVVRETRRYDEERKVTQAARKKEFEEDYGFIGEPDLGIYHVAEMAAALELPETPLLRAKRFEQEHGLEPALARQMVQTSMGLAELFEQLAKTHPVAALIPWVTGPLTSNWKDLEPRLDEETVELITSTISDVRDGTIADTECRLRITSIAKGVSMEASEGGDLDRMIDEYLDQHPEVVDDYRKNEKAANRVIGQVMKVSKGAHSSQEVVETVRRKMEERV
jgi:aspartyl-tRNA(Asn)/glutamyl-tRNA(Gln) amidotransferase subunit B